MSSTTGASASEVVRPVTLGFRFHIARYRTSLSILVIGAAIFLGHLRYFVSPHYEINSDSATGNLGLYESMMEHGLSLFDPAEPKRLMPVLWQLNRLSMYVFGPEPWAAQLPHQIQTALAAAFFYFFLLRQFGLYAALVGLVPFVFSGPMRYLIYEALPSSEIVLIGCFALWALTYPRFSPLVRGFVVGGAALYGATLGYQPSLCFLLGLPAYVWAVRERNDLPVPLGTKVISIVVIAGLSAVVLVWAALFLEWVPAVRLGDLRLTIHVGSKLLLASMAIAPLVLRAVHPTVRTPQPLLSRVWPLVIVAGLLALAASYRFLVSAAVHWEADSHFRQSTVSSLGHNLTVLHDGISFFLANDLERAPLRVLAPVLYHAFVLFHAVALLCFVIDREYRYACLRNPLCYGYGASMGAFLLQGNLVGSQEFRYIPLVFPVYFVLFFQLVQHVVRRANTPVFARVVFVAAFLTVLTFSAVSYAAEQWTPHPDGVRIHAMIEYLDEEHVDRGYGDYWFSHNIIFITKKRIEIRPLYSMFLPQYAGKFPDPPRRIAYISKNADDKYVKPFGVRYRVIKRRQFGDMWVLIAKKGR